jgi:hypothetical protein
VTVVDIPDEPPVGTTLTAPRMDNAYRRTDRGWYVIDPDGTPRHPGLPGASWRSVAHNLAIFGGILTVTTEYQVAYRFFDPTIDDEADRELGDVVLIGGFLSREHITDEQRNEIETVRLGIVSFPRARRRRTCNTRANEAGCQGIAVGDRYARVSFPPGAEPFYHDGWVTLIECEPCSNWWGRPFPEPRDPS